MTTQTSVILIVDDQATGREALEALLLTPEYQLAFAADGPEALQKAVELTPDLILLDVMLPGMDGYEVCRHLRANPGLAEVPVVMVTALDDQESRLKGLEAGADDFISKPFNRAELRARVKTIIRLNRYRRLLLERTYRQEVEAEIHRRNYEMMLLNHVITMVTSTLNVPDILYVAGEALANIFGVPQATAVLLNKDQTRFATVVEYRAPAVPFNNTSGEERPPDQPGSWHEPIPVTGLLSEYISRYKTILAIVDEPADPQLTPVYKLLHELGLASLLIVPILIDDRVAGMIELKTAEYRFFSDLDLTLAQSIGAAVGKAIENAFLYQELRHHAATLEEAVAKQAQNLQLEHNHSQAILEVLEEPVIVTDAQGLIQYINPAGVALTGFLAEERVEPGWCLWLDEKVIVKGYEDRTGKILAGQLWRGQVVHHRKDGTLSHIALRIFPLFGPDSSKPPVGFVYLPQNVS